MKMKRQKEKYLRGREGRAGRSAEDVRQSQMFRKQMWWMYWSTKEITSREKNGRQAQNRDRQTTMIIIKQWLSRNTDHTVSHTMDVLSLFNSFTVLTFIWSVAEKHSFLQSQERRRLLEMKMKNFAVPESVTLHADRSPLILTHTFISGTHLHTHLLCSGWSTALGPQGGEEKWTQNKFLTNIYCTDTITNYNYHSLTCALPLGEGIVLILVTA